MDEQEERLVGPVARDLVQLADRVEGDLLVVVGLHAGVADARRQDALHGVVPRERIVERAAPVGRPVDVGRVDIRRQTLLEPVELVRPHEVHLPRDGRVVAGRAQGVDDGRRSGGQLRGVVIHPHR
jgi:hypothetical protein